MASSVDVAEAAETPHPPVVIPTPPIGSNAAKTPRDAIVEEAMRSSRPATPPSKKHSPAKSAKRDRGPRKSAPAPSTPRTGSPPPGALDLSTPRMRPSPRLEIALRNRRKSMTLQPFSRVRLVRSLSLGSTPDWYIILHAEEARFSPPAGMVEDEVKDPAEEAPATAPAMARHQSTPSPKIVRANSTRAPASAATELEDTDAESAVLDDSRLTMESTASSTWSHRATPSHTGPFDLHPHHHLPPSASRHLMTSLSPPRSPLVVGKDALFFTPEIEVETPSSAPLPFFPPQSSRSRRTHRRNSLSADDIVLRASSLIKDEELFFNPEHRGVTLDDLMLNNMDARLLAGELPRVPHRSLGFWAPGRGGRKLLRFMGGVGSPRLRRPSLPETERPSTPRISEPKGDGNAVPRTPAKHRRPGSMPRNIASSQHRSSGHYAPVTFDTVVANINANVDAYNAACNRSQPESMMTALLAIRGFCQMLVDEKPDGLEGLLPETLKGIADLAAMVELYKPRLALVLTVDRYRGLVVEGRSLKKRRGTLLRIEELAMSILHDVAEEGRRVGGLVLHLRADQVAALHDARQRARNSQIWLDFVMDMYKALPPDSMVERVHASSMDEDGESEAPRQLQREYQLEKYGAPIPIPAIFLKPYYDLWEKQRRETGDTISFQHFLYLQILRHKDVVDLAHSNPTAVEDLIKKGIGNGIPDQVTVTYLTTPEQREIYRAFVKTGRLYSVNATLGTRRLLDTKRYKTMWQVTGAGYAICVFREAEGLYLADHVTNRFHHSSIFAGEPVDFAGELRVAHGAIQEVNNKSGHYKPGRRETLKFLLFLHHSGVELLGVDFRLVSPTALEGEMKDAAELLRELAPEGSLPPIDYERRSSMLGNTAGSASNATDERNSSALNALGESARGVLSSLAEKRVNLSRKVRRAIAHSKDVASMDEHEA